MGKILPRNKSDNLSTFTVETSFRARFSNVTKIAGKKRISDDTKYLKTNVTIRVANVSFPSTRGPHKENHEGRNQQRYHDVVQFYVSVYFTVAPKGSTIEKFN